MSSQQEDILGQLSKVARLVKRDIDATLTQYSLHTGQWALLKAVSLLEPVSQVTLSKYLVIEKPAVTKTVARLEELGFIFRQNSGRHRLVELTSQARDLFHTIDASVQQAHRTFLDELSPEDQSTLERLMTQLLHTHRQVEQEESS
ncbi:MarR family winged helix-turn-helix transcriptional regulator [Exiguobacterium acetylicum]|uniref:MarR family winged helix-turn-helix transcriptional regulator n=1 Tax=Exiguobacterium sp. BMC-KP TaxID=1684312 RepID=UPI0006AA15ED|nr:MarR family transcriptional regulator [Exiguobacterium sp. BMC-KP]KOP29929.1 MarR family transcriptional regulator [Exiguobacterium sp. BMC-KP]